MMCSVMNFVGHGYHKEKSTRLDDVEEDEGTVDSTDDLGA